jgi:hypothetical protein
MNQTRVRLPGLDHNPPALISGRCRGGGAVRAPRAAPVSSADQARNKRQVSASHVLLLLRWPSYLTIPARYHCPICGLTTSCIRLCCMSILLLRPCRSFMQLPCEGSFSDCLIGLACSLSLRSLQIKQSRQSWLDARTTLDKAYRTYSTRLFRYLALVEGELSNSSMSWRPKVGVALKLLFPPS